MFTYLILSAVVSIANGKMMHLNHEIRRIKLQTDGTLDIDPFTREIPIEKISHHVSIQRTGQHICDGSIISENYVITNILCFTADSVRAGSNYTNIGGSIHRVINVVNFTQTLERDDILLLKIAPSFIFDQTRSPIMLSQSEVYPNSLVMVTWFHRAKDSTESQYLTGKYMLVSKKNECNMIFDQEHSNAFICGGNSAHLDNSVCPNLLGSPVFYSNILVGIGMHHLSCYSMYTSELYSSIPYYERAVTYILQTNP